MPRKLLRRRAQGDQCRLLELRRLFEAETVPDQLRENREVQKDVDNRIAAGEHIQLYSERQTGMQEVFFKYFELVRRRNICVSHEDIPK